VAREVHGPGAAIDGTAPRRDGDTTNLSESRRVLAATQLAILGAEIWSPDQSAFTVVSAVRVTGVQDWRMLIDAVNVTLTRHDVFTWRLDLNDSYQIVASGGPRGDGMAYTAEAVDLTDVSPVEAETAVQVRLRRERQRVISVLDAASRPYTRMILFRMSRGAHGGGDAGVCALVTHHVFVDEYSTELIWNEVFQRTAGRGFTGDYDRRYADWAAASVSDAAKAGARRAAQDIVGRLRSSPLGSIGEESPARADGVVGSPLRFTIPVELNEAASAQARDLELPVSAVYSAALVHTLCSRVSGQSLAVSVPMTRRKSVKDIHVVGCYVSAIPVLAESMGDNASRAAAIHRWHRSLAFSSARAHADVEALRDGIGSTQQVSLAFEARGGLRTASPIRWAPMPPPNSLAKSALAVFLSPGSRRRVGDGRLLWRMGILTERSAHALVAEFIANLTYFAIADGKNSGLGAS
jgi:hypothetical protein